jgi:hypothetical protein
MREDLKEGYNIVYGTGDSIPRAISVLTGHMREAYELFSVQTVGGLVIKEDGKERFHALREVVLTAPTCSPVHMQPKSTGKAKEPRNGKV